MQNKETKKIGLAPRRQKGYLLYIAVCLIALAVIIWLGVVFVRQYNHVGFVEAKIANQTYRLEVADTESEREKGLSERNGMASGTGMLFAFKQNGDWRIWMVQMRFPIDVLWLNENKQIIHIKHNATPAEYPEVYKAGQQSRYVIELPSGTAKMLNLKEGDTIRF